MLLTAAAAVFVTFTLTKKMPDSYSAKARIATGLVDQSEAMLFSSEGDLGESQINLQFANLIQSMQLKKMLDQVSYKLMLNDLQHPDSAFRKPSKKLLAVSDKDKQHITELLLLKYKNREPLYLFNAKENAVNELIGSMGYDIESIKNKLGIGRASNSDFIDLDFESESKQMPAFVLNTLCTEFISYYTYLTKENKIKSVNFLERLLQERKEAMNGQLQKLKNYKIENRILNLSEQAKSLYAQISAYEERQASTEKEIIAMSGTIRKIENKFNPKDRQYIENTLIKINNDIINTKENLRRTTVDYIKSNYDPKIKIKIDSLQTVLTSEIQLSTDKYILNPLATKEALIAQKLNFEIQLEMAKNSVATVNNQLEKLYKRFDKLVPHEAVIQSFESEIDIAKKEYLELENKYNQTSMESGFVLRLKQIEMAMPGPPAPSKRMILVAASGVIVVVVYIIVLFIVFYMDDSIKVSKELANKTETVVLGYLPELRKSLLNLQDVWDKSAANPDYQKYKDLLRSARFEVEQELKSDKIVALTSLGSGEGKTFVTLSLAYAYSVTNKKVLIIDGNFENPDATEISKTTLFIEDIIHRNLQEQPLVATSNVTVLGNKGGDISLYELCSEQHIREQIQQLSQQFDLIIIDTPSLEALNKAKEWLVLSNKVVSVYLANFSIDGAKQMRINYLKELDGQFAGWILNKVAQKKSRLQRIIWKLKSRKKRKKHVK